MSGLRIRFVNADIGHSARDSFLVRLTEAATGEKIRVLASHKGDCDIEFSSVQYPGLERARREGSRQVLRLVPRRMSSRDPRWASLNPQPSGRAHSHIWFTGENVRPPLGPWSGYLSFDLDPLNGRNAYCPLWWWSVGLLGPARSPFLSPAPHLDQLMSSRLPEPARPGFVAAFINNPNPMRLHAIEALRRFGTVDVYGRAVGRPIANKADVARRYKFVLCFENDLYPGYVTEKPIEAWACGAVPIYWGDDAAGYLNPQAIVNGAEFTSLEAMAHRVYQLQIEHGAWEEMAAQPLVLKSPNLSPVLALVRRAVGI